MNISEPFIRRPVMTLLLTAAAILFGVLAYRQLPVNDLPPVDYPVIQVQVSYPGASPQTVANNIATPLERQFMQIAGLELVTSRSTQGTVGMTLQFALDKSIDAAATDVQTAISQATGNLPFDLPSPPTFSKTNPNDQPVMYIALTSDSMTGGQLYDLASTKVGQRMSIISGVSKVQVYGTKSAIRVKADPSLLAARQMTMQDLAAAIREGTSSQGAGQVDGPNKTFVLEPQGQLSTAEAYNDLIVGMHDNAPVYLRDVAVATQSVQDERQDMRFWSRGRTTPKATVVVAVNRQAGANAIQVASAILDVIEEVKVTLPGSVSIAPIHSRAKTIVNSVNDVKETLYIAFFLVVAVIFIFLGRATDTLIPVVVLPLSLLITFIAMRALGYTLDNLSLMALTLAIGFLVDDAIVFLENAVRRMEKFNEPPLKAAMNGASEISFTILSMTLSLAAVFIPLVFMGGLVGRIFREFAVTIIIAVLASGVVSLTLTPLMCARMLSRRGEGHRKTFFERAFEAVEQPVLAFYSRTLWFFLRNKWISACVWVVTLIGTIWLLVALPKSFLPLGDSGFIMGIMIGQEGSSPQQMRQYQSLADKVLQSNDAVATTFTMTGATNFLPSNQGFLLAFLKDKEKERRPKTAEVAGELMGKVRDGIPGAMAFLQAQPVLEISTATGRQQGQFAFTVSGLNPEQVMDVGRKLLFTFAPDQKHFMSVSTDLYTNTPSLTIDILRDRASMYGISARKIETLLRDAYSQNYVYLIKKPDDQYQVILEVKDQARNHPEDLEKLYVRSDDGKNLVPLKAVASWRPTLGPQAVNHTNQFTSVTLFFNTAPGVTIGQATDHIVQTAKTIVPIEMRSQFQGEALTFRESMSSLAILMVLAVFVMYVILGILYESFLHPITVLSTLPTAMVGGLLALLLFGQEASLYAFIGLFMLMGIVKKNGIMIVDFAVHRVAAGMTATDAIHEASVDRFRPIVMTTLAAVMGAIPIALGFGADGEGRRPLGIVIVGGLLVSQLITLYVTPVIYLYLEIIQEKVLGRWNAWRVRTRPDLAADSRIPLAALASTGNGDQGNGHHE